MTASYALEMLNRQKYSLVILDILLPDRSGLDLLKDIVILYPKLPVIILSSHDEEKYALRALKSGAFGYINKGCATNELLIAIKQVFQGQKYLPPTITNHLIQNLGTEVEKMPHESLSNREFEVFLLISKGTSNKQIANQLFLSEKTISTYRSRILDKMQMKNNAQLILYANKQKLLL